MREVKPPNGFGEPGLLDDKVGAWDERGDWALDVIDVVVVSAVKLGSPGLMVIIVTDSLVRSVTVTKGLPFDRPDQKFILTAIKKPVYSEIICYGLSWKFSWTKLRG